MHYVPYVLSAVFVIFGMYMWYTKIPKYTTDASRDRAIILVHHNQKMGLGLLTLAVALFIAGYYHP